MIWSDIIVAIQIHHFSVRYNEQIWADPDSGTFQIVTNAKTPPRFMHPFIDNQDIPGCLYRLNDLGYIKLSAILGEMYFFVTPKMNHWLQFFFDSFSKKFLGGFLTGITVTVIGGLLLAYVRVKLGI